MPSEKQLKSTTTTLTRGGKGSKGKSKDSDPNDVKFQKSEFFAKIKFRLN